MGRAVMKDMARAVKARRIERGLSRRQVAHAAGIDLSALSRIETARRHPSMAMVEKLCAALDMDVIIGPEGTIITWTEAQAA